MAGCWALLGMTAACTKKKPLYDLEYLQGEWLRLPGEKPQYDGMRLKIESDYARITELPSGYSNYFEIGDLKWKDITPRFFRSGEVHYRFHDAGSSGGYWSGSMQVVDDSTLKISHELPLDGGEQWWRKIQ